MSRHCKVFWLHFNYFLSFQWPCCKQNHHGLAAFACCIFVIVGSGLALNLIADSLLLVGSIKQDQGTLNAGLVLNGITTLGLFLVFVCGFLSARDLIESISLRFLSIVGFIIIVVFKIWTFVIGVGAVQKVKTIWVSNKTEQNKNMIWWFCIVHTFQKKIWKKYRKSAAKFSIDSTGNITFGLSCLYQKL